MKYPHLFVAFVIIVFVAGLLAGANVTPLLSGSGKIIFPENATSATLSASSGALGVNAGGTNQGITLTPTGTGTTYAVGNHGSTSAKASLEVSGMFRATDFNVPTSGAGIEAFYNSGGFINAYDRGASSYKTLTLNGSSLVLNNSTVGTTCVNQASCTYALDTLGDTNTSGVYRVGGTQVVSSRQAAITPPTGGSTIDSQARTAINTLIARLQTHGLIN
jgi:hypothetical protein